MPHFIGHRKARANPTGCEGLPWCIVSIATLMRHFTSTLKISVTSSSSTKHRKRPAGSDISQVVGSSNQFYRYKQHALKPLGEDIGDYNHEIFIWIQYHCHWTAPFQLGFPKKRRVSKDPPANQIPNSTPMVTSAFKNKNATCCNFRSDTDKERRS